MFTKKMTTRFAQIAPLALAMTFSLSALAGGHRLDSNGGSNGGGSEPRNGASPGGNVQPWISRVTARGMLNDPKLLDVAVNTGPSGKARGTIGGTDLDPIRIDPAGGIPQGDLTVDEAATSGRRMNPDGGSNGGGSEPRSGASPGGNVQPWISRVTARGMLTDPKLLDLKVLDPKQLDVNGDKGLPGKSRLTIDNNDLDPIAKDPARRAHATLGPIDSDPIVINPEGGIPLDDLTVDEAATSVAKAARSAARIPQVLLPKIGQAPVAASGSALSRSHFAVSPNGEGGLAASATFTFGRH